MVNFWNSEFNKKIPSILASILLTHLMYRSDMVDYIIDGCTQTRYTQDLLDTSLKIYVVWWHTNICIRCFFYKVMIFVLFVTCWLQKYVPLPTWNLTKPQTRRKTLMYDTSPKIQFTRLLMHLLPGCDIYHWESLVIPGRLIGWRRQPWMRELRQFVCSSAGIYVNSETLNEGGWVAV